MRKRVYGLREQYEELVDQIRTLCDIMKDAIDDVVVSVESVEDVRESDVETFEEIVAGLRKKVTGALDILISALEELLDIFAYDVGVEEVEELPGEEEVFDEEVFEEIPEEEIPEEEEVEEVEEEGEVVEEEVIEEE